MIIMMIIYFIINSTYIYSGLFVSWCNFTFDIYVCFLRLLLIDGWMHGWINEELDRSMHTKLHERNFRGFWSIESQQEHRTSLALTVNRGTWSRADRTLLHVYGPKGYFSERVSLDLRISGDFPCLLAIGKEAQFAENRPCLHDGHVNQYNWGHGTPWQAMASSS